MRMLVESLRRLYHTGKLEEQKIREMQSEEKITEEEAEYILS